MLIQNQPDGANKLLRYCSLSSNAAEPNFNTTHREFLAVVWAMFPILPYLKRLRFTIGIGRSAFTWMLNLADSTGRVARWRLCVFEFDFEVVHGAGIKDDAADESDRSDKTLLEDNIPGLVGSAVQSIEPQNDEQGGPSLDKYCVCEGRDFTAG